MSAPAATPRRSRRLLLSSLALAAIAGSGWAVWSHNRKPKPEDEYLLVTVQKGDIEDSVSATGSLQPKNYVDVGAQVGGQLKTLNVEVGSQVKAGDLLAEIDATVYLAKVDASRAQLKNQRAQLTDREAQATLAELQFKRQKNLLAGDAGTAEQYQSAEASARSARAQVEALKAQIEQTESTLRADEANLNYAKIYAPISGTVASITARLGQTLNTNQQAPTILRISDLGTMTVQTQVSEADVQRLRRDTPAYFTTLGNANRKYWGALAKIEPTPVVQNNVVLYNALFDVPNSSQSLMTQMTAQVFFVIGSAREALLVPLAAVKLEGRGPGGRNRPGGRGPEGGPAASGASGVAGESAAAPQPAPSQPAVAVNPVAASADAEREAASGRNAARRERPAPATAAAPASGSTRRNVRPDAGEAGERPADPRFADGERAERGEGSERAQRGERPPRGMGPGGGEWSEEARQRWAERRAARAEAGGDGAPAPRERRRRDEQAGDAGPTAQPRVALRAGHDDGSGERAPRMRAPGSASPAGETATGMRRRGAASGASGLPQGQEPMRIRRGTVRVVNERTGEIEERAVTIGITNRIQAQVLSGLKEGDRVVAGKRPTAADASRSDASRNLPPGMGGPGGMGGGAGGGRAGGGGR